MEFVLALLTGTAIGYFAQGIKITITHKHEQPQQPEKKTEYNESLVGLLPAEVQKYYHDTNGHNKF